MLVFVSGSCGVVAVSSGSGRRVGGSAVVSACRARVRSCVGGSWVASRRVRGVLAGVRRVLRGQRLAVLRRSAARLRAVGVRAECGAVGVSVRARARVFGVLRAVARARVSGRWAFSVRARAGFPGVSWGGLVRAVWRGLPPRVRGRVGVASRRGALWAWVCVGVRVAGRLSGAVWLCVRVAGGVWPVVGLPGGGGGGGGRRPSVPSVFSASGAGSALWLSSPEVISAVAEGACPVSLACRVFRWPVRSAVLWSLWGALASPIACKLPRSLLASFVAEALRALGWRFSPSAGFGVGHIARAMMPVLDFLAKRSAGCVMPSLVNSWSVSASWSISAVSDALRSVTRCLAWLSAHSEGRVACPPALRGALASVACSAWTHIG